MSLTRSHPKLKNRINKYMDNLDEVKTWVDMETSEPNIDLRGPITSLASSHISKEYNIYMGASEKEVEGLYCDSPTFIYLNPDNKNKHISCKNLVWNCGKCVVDLKRRRLDRMNKMIDKFDHYSDIDRSNLYHLIIRDYTKQGLTAAKITKRLKYLGFDMLMYIIDEKEDIITYLLEDWLDGKNILDSFDKHPTCVKISFDYAINHIGINDKYNFLGKFHKAIPSVKIKGITQEDLDIIDNESIYGPKKLAEKNEYCNCGETWGDHTRRKATAYQLAKVIKPEDHYEDGFNEFNKVHLSHLFYED